MEENTTHNCYDIPIVGQGAKLVIWPLEDLSDAPEHLAEVSENCTGWVCTEEREDGVFIHLFFHLVECLAEQAGIIAHECLHTVNLIHRLTGQNYNIDIGDDEFACYLMQWLVETCHNHTHRVK